MEEEKLKKEEVIITSKKLVYTLPGVNFSITFNTTNIEEIENLRKCLAVAYKDLSEHLLTKDES